jgi:cytochrome o ubiquinol oxidase subunit 2
MNSFFVPQLGSQIYAMPGMTTELHLEADHPGTWQGLSAQFSGEGFSDMRFDAVAIPAAEFADWIRATKAGGAVLDQNAFDELARPARAQGVSTYAHVANGLFDRVARGAMDMTGTDGER